MKTCNCCFSEKEIWQKESEKMKEEKKKLEEQKEQDATKIKEYSVSNFVPSKVEVEKHIKKKCFKIIL